MCRNLLIAVLISVAYFLYAKKPGNIGARYTETFFLSSSFFLSMIPTVNETFNRIPIGHPLAHGPKDPLIGKTLLLLLIMLVVGSVLQFKKQKKINKSL